MTMVYRNVASTNTSRLEAHPGFFRLLMKNYFDAYLCTPLGENLTLKYKHELILATFNTVCNMYKA